MKSIILNLHKDTRKRYEVSGLMRRMGFYENRLAFWHGPDAMHYGVYHDGKPIGPQTFNVILHAIGDGFPRGC